MCCQIFKLYFLLATRVKKYDNYNDVIEAISIGEERVAYVRNRDSEFAEDY